MKIKNFGIVISAQFRVIGIYGLKCHIQLLFRCPSSKGQFIAIFTQSFSWVLKDCSKQASHIFIPPQTFRQSAVVLQYGDNGIIRNPVKCACQRPSLFPYSIGIWCSSKTICIVGVTPQFIHNLHCTRLSSSRPCVFSRFDSVSHNTKRMSS